MQGYELRLVGHSLGGSTAALLALMLRRLGDEQLGFSSQLIKAVTIASPPCVSEKLASECADYITTLVLQVIFWPLTVLYAKYCRMNILTWDYSSMELEVTASFFCIMLCA